MKKPLIVNLWGGPGSGKSTLMAGLFHALKSLGIRCEMTPEWIKQRVYAKDPYAPNDQLMVFAQQRKLLKEIGEQVDVIITDSPLLLSLYYGRGKEPPEFFEMVKRYDAEFNNCHVWVAREKPFDPVGRYQKTEAEAVEIDAQLWMIFQQLHPRSFSRFYHTNDPLISTNGIRPALIWYIRQAIGNIPKFQEKGETNGTKKTSSPAFRIDQ